MDLDLPLILVILTFVGLLIWLLDIALLKPKRQKGIANLQTLYPEWAMAESKDAKQYHQQLPQVDHEYAVVKEVKSLLPILLLVLVVRSFLVEPFQIPSASMEPTLNVGDFILVNKFTYGFRLPVLGTKVISMSLPQRGDVMVFIPPNDKRYFIKRVVGIPGDEIDYHNRTLTVNGIVQPIDFVKDAPIDLLGRDLYMETLNGVKHKVFNQPSHESKEYKGIVQPGHYFMMGDNRDNSSDSRYWGQVPEDHVVGKAFAIWMHWKDWTSLPSFSRVGNIN